MRWPESREHPVLRRTVKLLPQGVEQERAPVHKRVPDSHPVLGTGTPLAAVHVRGEAVAARHLAPVPVRIRAAARTGPGRRRRTRRPRPRWSSRIVTQGRWTHSIRRCRRPAAASGKQSAVTGSPDVRRMWRSPASTRSGCGQILARSSAGSAASRRFRGAGTGIAGLPREAPCRLMSAGAHGSRSHPRRRVSAGDGRQMGARLGNERSVIAAAVEMGRHRRFPAVVYGIRQRTAAARR